MESKHTPGPWIFYADLPSADPSWHIVTTANRMRVLANVHIEPGNAMDDANARLIAAAPDLFEALKAVVAPYASQSEQALFGLLYEHEAQLIVGARAAIDKATGGS